MEELIKKILQIEKDAQEIVQSARDAQENFSADMESQLSILRTDINTEAQHKIQQLEVYEKNITEDKLAEMQRDTDAKLQELDELYSQNAGIWADQIFAGVVSAQK